MQIIKRALWKRLRIQQVMTAPGKIIFREIPTPQVEKGQVLVKVRMIGICGSDIHVYHGKHPFPSCPVTRGHEGSGEVVAFGDGVTGFEVGQKAAIAAEARGGVCIIAIRLLYAKSL